MSCLDATFTLTPQSPNFYSDTLGSAQLYCFGADFLSYSPLDLSSLYASNRFYFNSSFAGNPNLDYAQWANRKKAQFLACYIALQRYAAGHNKQLALIFGFDVLSVSGLPVPGRVLVYNDASRLSDQTLVYGDNQFLLEIESLDQTVDLYFVHTGGDWCFTGLSGYVV
jgi:hypothetical protein